MVVVNRIVNYQYGKYLKEFSGLSTDTKPTDSDLLQNSLFLELNTGDTYYYTGSTWTKVGA